MTLGDGKVYFTGANALQLLDMETGMRRVPTSEDCARLTRVFDAPEHVHAILPAVIPQDVPQGISDRVKCKISYENCEKHYLTDVYGKGAAFGRFLVRILGAGKECLRGRYYFRI